MLIRLMWIGFLQNEHHILEGVSNTYLACILFIGLFHTADVKGITYTVHSIVKVHQCRQFCCSGQGAVSLVMLPLVVSWLYCNYQSIAWWLTCRWSSCRFHRTDADNILSAVGTYASTAGRW